MFDKDEAKVASRVSGVKCGVVYLVKLFLSPMSKNSVLGETGSHPGRDLMKGILHVGDA